MKWWKPYGLIGPVGENGVDHRNGIVAQAGQTRLLPVVRGGQIGDGR